MNHLRGCAPLIAYTLLTGVSWLLAAVVGLLLGLAVVVADRRQGRDWDAELLPLSGMAFFAVSAVVATLAPQSPLQAYANPLCVTWLLLIAVLSLVARRPFTLAIARARVPAQVAASAAFRHVNTVLSSVWAVAFAGMATVGALGVALHAGRAVTVACPILIAAAGAVISYFYARRVRRHPAERTA